MLHCRPALRLILHDLLSLQTGSICRCHADATKEAHRREEQWSCCHRLQPQHVPLPASPGQHAAPATRLHPHRWASAPVSVTEASADPEEKQEALLTLASVRVLMLWMTRCSNGVTNDEGVSSHCMRIVSLCSFPSAVMLVSSLQRFPLRLTSARLASSLWRLCTVFRVCD